MTKDVWIQEVTSHIENQNRREEIARELDEKLTERIGDNTDTDISHLFGDPAEYYNRNYRRKQSTAFDTISGFMLILIGIMMIIVTAMSAYCIRIDQLYWNPVVRNFFFYGAGLLLGFVSALAIEYVKER